LDYISKLEQYKRDGQKKFYEKLLKEDLKGVIKEGFMIAKSVMPNQEYFEPSLVMLLDAPGNDARVLYYDKAGVNLTTLFYDTFYKSKYKKNLDMAFAVDKIRSFAAHEGNHLFLRQVNYEKSNSWINEVLFSEGLATYVETEHLTNHYDFLKENDFWIDSLKEVDDSKGLGDKISALKQMAKSPALNKYNSKACIEISNISDKISIGEFNKILSNALLKNKCPIYHVDYNMWDSISKKLGEEKIKEIVKKGPDYFVSEYIKLK